MSYDNGLFPGGKILGRWNGKIYQVIRALGKGANGEVLLVTENRRKLALKKSGDLQGIALEYQLLKKLQAASPKIERECRDFRLGPFVYDLDDVVTELGGAEFFYTMEYIAGVPVSAYIGERGAHRVQAILIRLLEYLQQLHRRGYTFGDMKAENVLIDPVTKEVRLVDFGGLTRFGEAVRQYTEWNDRAYWAAGSRRADAEYDLFAVAMLALQLLGVKPGPNGSKNVVGLLSQLGMLPWGNVWLPVLQKALRGHYKSASDMRLDVVKIRKTKVLGSASTAYRDKVRAELVRDWDWSDWTVLGTAVICLFMFLKFLMVQ